MKKFVELPIEIDGWPLVALLVAGHKIVLAKKPAAVGRTFRNPFNFCKANLSHNLKRERESSTLLIRFPFLVGREGTASKFSLP